MAENIFNQQIAENYDHADRSRFEEAELAVTSSFLFELSQGQRALEFAIGTGRVALPLLARGIEVHGIELSQPMVDQLLAKPDGNNIDVVVGDMVSTTVPGTFQLVYLVYNTITNLITQAEQVACFVNAASHLHAGGFFVIEDQVPALQKLPNGSKILAFDATEEHVGVDEFDIVNQRLVSHHYWTRGGSMETFHSTHRYAWPAEYDLMARIAGLDFYGRWGGWDKSDFTAESSSHISVWKKPV